MNFKIDQEFLDAFFGTGYDQGNACVTNGHGNHYVSAVNHKLALMLGVGLPVPSALHERLKDGGTLLTDETFEIGGTTYAIVMGSGGPEPVAQ